ncbi:uncharacterized protein [Halyomorpha halys]|uniref:uncharacterized protein n=1 Tax=Halyomorpha halys TaxID=286706 RepID=UPI0034D2407F
MALFPLSRILRKNKEYKLATNDEGTTVSHSWYMDDLKLYAKYKEQLQNMVEAVSSFTRDIGMSFGLDKCAVLHVTKWKVVSKQNILINEEEHIKELEANKLYKYLGMQQYLKISRKDMQQKFLTMLKIRLCKVFKTQLTGKQKIKAINTWAIPGLSYSFGIVQ